MGQSLFFTGHRPKDLGKCYLKSDSLFKIYKDVTKSAIQELSRDIEVTECVTGGALGMDKIALYAVDELKREGMRIKSVLAIPFDHQPIAWVSDELKKAFLNEWDGKSRCMEVLGQFIGTKAWFAKTLEEYQEMIDLADEVVYVDELEGYSTIDLPMRYHVRKLQVRNEYMVDRADMGVALFNGKKGGTWNCVNYANEQNKPVNVIRPSSMRFERSAKDSLGVWQTLEDRS